MASTPEEGEQGMDRGSLGHAEIEVSVREERTGWGGKAKRYGHLRGGDPRATCRERWGANSERRGEQTCHGKCRCNWE
jgi:hypothetical protein